MGTVATMPSQPTHRPADAHRTDVVGGYPLNCYSIITLKKAAKRYDTAVVVSNDNDSWTEGELISSAYGKQYVVSLGVFFFSFFSVASRSVGLLAPGKLLAH